MNDKATELFLFYKLVIDNRIAELASLSEDHFSVDPDSLNYGHVGDMQRLADTLQRALDIARPKQPA